MKTYHDTFVEQLIRRQRPGGEVLFKCGAVLAGLILTAAAFLFVRSFFPVCFALVVIMEFFAFVYTVKEYEYSFINGDVDIDMIQGKRRRKTVLSVSCRQIVTMAPVREGASALSGNYDRILDASESSRSEGRWYFITESQDGRQELVYLNPNQRLLTAFKDYLGRKMDYTPQTEHKDTAE